MMMVTKIVRENNLGYDGGVIFLSLHLLFLLLLLLLLLFSTSYIIVFKRYGAKLSVTKVSN